MPYVTMLEMQLRCKKYRLFPSTNLMTPCYAAPIVCLGIIEGALGPGRVYLVELIAALSDTLQTVTLESCSLSADLIHDVVLVHLSLKQLYLYGCEVGSTNSSDPTAPSLSTPHPTNLELGFFFCS